MRKARERRSINVYVGDMIELEMRGGLLKRWTVIEYIETTGAMPSVIVRDQESHNTHTESIANVRVGVISGSLAIRRGAANAMLAAPLGSLTARAQQAVRA